MRVPMGLELRLLREGACPDVLHCSWADVPDETIGELVRLGWLRPDPETETEDYWSWRTTRDGELALTLAMVVSP